MSVTRMKNWTVGRGGLLKSTRNISFDNEGVVTLAPKATSIYSTSNNASFTTILSIAYYSTGGLYLVATRGGVFSLSPTNLTLTELSSSPPPMDQYGDAVAWQNRVYITSTNNLYYYSDTFTGSLKSTTSNVPHPLCVFENKNSLMVGNGNVVYLLDSSHSTTVTLTLPVDFQVNTITWRNNIAYIGTTALNGSNAKVFLWDGASTSAQAGYDIGADQVFSLCNYQSSVACVTSAGQILRFNGGGFEPLVSSDGRQAAFPVYYTDYAWSKTTGLSRVFNRGMTVDGDVLHINIDGLVSDALGTTIGATTFPNDFFLSEQPSGVWTFDPKVGLYHRHLSTKDGYSALTATALGSNQLTLSTDTKLTTGEPVLVKTLGSLTGLKAGKVYYAIIDNPFSNYLKLASTPSNAIAGNALTIGGSVTSAVFWVLSYNTVGEICSPGGATGAIAKLNPAFQPPALFYPSLIWGANMYVSGGASTMAVLNLESKGKNVGSFVFDKVYSPNREENFYGVLTRFKNVVADGQRIRLSSKLLDKPGFPSDLVDGTYTSDLIISSTAQEISETSERDSIIITTAYGAGHTRDVSGVATDTYTLSEAVPVVSAAQQLLFYVNNFELFDTITNETHNIELGYKESPLSPNSTPSKAVEIKYDLEGTKTEIQEIMMITKPHSKLE